MSQVAWSAAGAAATVSAVSPFVVRPWLRARSIVDIPNSRSSHAATTLRGGGIAPLLGIAVASVLVLGLASGRDARLISIVLASGILAGLVGLAEDIRGLRVLARAGLQLGIGCATSVAVVALIRPDLWPWVALAAIAYAAYVNFTNFMDGINGISSSHAVVTGVAFAAIGAETGADWLVVVGICLAAAYAVFVPWNFLPPGMFLGDVGSYLLGGLVGAITIAALADGLPTVSVLAPLAIYLGDPGSTLVRRAVRAEGVLTPHRTHAYQRLTDTGLSHLAVSLIVTCFAAIPAAAGWLAASDRIATPTAAIIAVGATAVYLALPRLRGHRLAPSHAPPLAEIAPPEAARPTPNFEPRTWAVVGGTGFIGRAMMESLVQSGMSVREISAPRLRLDPVAHDGAAIADLGLTETSTTSLTEALKGVDVVVNAAGVADPDSAATPELYGANALLPAVLTHACAAAKVTRLVHLSSAAVQGDRCVLDDSPHTQPFSPYSRAKALGERAVFAAANRYRALNVCVVRATSVQGPGRATTERLRRLAASPLSSVAAPGTQPTVVSSISGLTTFVLEVGTTPGPVPAIALQPWEGSSVSEALRAIGDREPTVLPAWLCRGVVMAARALGRLIPELAGLGRRIELMWFGQKQTSAWDPAQSQNDSRGSTFDGEAG